MSTFLKVLLVEDSEDDATLLLRALRKGGFTPDWQRVETAADMSAALESRPWDVILCDFNLPAFSAPQAIDLLKASQMDIPIMVVSGAIGEEIAADCMRRGANDYILKNNLSRLSPAIEREIAEAQIREKRRETEEALRENESRLKEAQEMANLGFWRWEVKSGEVDWSEQVYKIFQLKPETFKPQIDSILEFSPWPEDHDRDQELIRRATESHEKGSYEQRFLRADGSMGFYYSTFHGLYDDGGKLTSIVGTVQDITERKHAEEERRNLETQLFSSQKMEAIGTLAGGIAHDFNNILSAIIGYAEILEMEVQEKALHNVRQILKASERARNLIKQILAFSRHVEPDKKPTDLRSVIQETLKLLRAAISTKIEMQVQLPAQPVIIQADYTQMHQVLMNIGTNAVHAMGEQGGLLEVCLSVESISEGNSGRELSLPAGSYAKLRVRDTGRGIDPVDIGRLFDPFFTTKKIGEGTGLGLAVVYGIIHDHGGGITVASRPGEGATFDIYLPVIEEVSITAETLQQKQIPRGCERILYVDDENGLVEMGRKILGSLGYSVTGCSQSEEALRIYRENPNAFDLVITDMNMPAMSGSELAISILEISRSQPIILCTGYSEFMNSEKAKEIGISAFVMKPFTRQVLATQVRKVLDQHIQPQEET